MSFTVEELKHVMEMDLTEEVKAIRLKMTVGVLARPQDSYRWSRVRRLAMERGINVSELLRFFSG